MKTCAILCVLMLLLGLGTTPSKAQDSERADHILMCRDGVLFEIPSNPVPNIGGRHISTLENDRDNDRVIFWQPGMPPLEASSIRINKWSAYST